MASRKTHAAAFAALSLAAALTLRAADGPPAAATQPSGGATTPDVQPRPQTASDAQAPAAAAAGATTQPTAAAAAAATTQPTAPTATVSADARKQLDAMRDAYGKLKTLTVTGALHGQIDVQGQKANPNNEFTGTFKAPNAFRQETKGDVVCGSDGTKTFIFIPKRNLYVTRDAPKDRTLLRDMGGEIPGLLKEQNLSLALAVSADAAKELLDGATAVTQGPDVKIADKAYPALAVTLPAVDMIVALDPETHLVRQQSVDLTRLFTSQGAQDIKAATIVADFTNAPDAPVTEASFAWAPPEGAKEFKPAAQPSAGGDNPEAAAQALAGKPAPTFKLTGLDGKEVSADSLKGSVYILDFWATWCGPCRASLPGLDKIYQDRQKDGLKVFAVNLQEDKAVAQKFVDSTKLSVPVLLDSDGSVGQAYSANAIPETVVVGKDGTIRKVFVGGGNEENISNEVEAALGAK